jgi:hypothetical protein
MKVRDILLLQRRLFELIKEENVLGDFSDVFGV